MVKTINRRLLPKTIITNVSARAETKEQVNGVSWGYQRGFSAADGGRKGAEKAFEEYTRSKLESAGPCDRGHGDAL